MYDCDAGSAGSKYGIIDDEIPLRTKDGEKITSTEREHDQAELQDLRLLLPQLVQKQLRHKFDTD